MTTQSAPGGVKNGITTTEFWQTMIVQVLTAVVAIASLFKSNFNLQGVQAVVPAVAVLAAALAQAYYSHSRAIVKAAAQNSVAQVASAQAATETGSPARPVKVRVEANGAPQTPNGSPQQPILVTFKGFEIAPHD